MSKCICLFSANPSIHIRENPHTIIIHNNFRQSKRKTVVVNSKSNANLLKFIYFYYFVSIKHLFFWCIHVTSDLGFFFSISLLCRQFFSKKLNGSRLYFPINEFVIKKKHLNSISLVKCLFGQFFNCLSVVFLSLSRGFF